ncbi:hypothetical protein [Burkholderia diffusa]|uniref:hypothetical protein n=1 Tax=Burkholderia diffusa TaxID=488732 RepID=UPI0012DAD79C|nr:hypothetical protein [Burkholderia diffusa]
MEADGARDRPRFDSLTFNPRNSGFLNAVDRQPRSYLGSPVHRARMARFGLTGDEIDPLLAEHRIDKSASFDRTADAHHSNTVASIARPARAAVDTSAAIVKTAITRADELWQHVKPTPELVAAFEQLRSHLSTGVIASSG